MSNSIKGCGPIEVTHSYSRKDSSPDQVKLFLLSLFILFINFRVLINRIRKRRIETLL